MKIAVEEQDELLSDLLSFRLELLSHEVVTWCSAGDMLAHLSEANVHLLKTQSNIVCPASIKFKTTMNSASALRQP